MDSAPAASAVLDRAGDPEVLIPKTIRELAAELDAEHFWQIHRSTAVIAVTRNNQVGRRTIKLLGLRGPRCSGSAGRIGHARAVSIFGIKAPPIFGVMAPL